MLVQRTERHNISRGSPLWQSCDELCFKSKNMYNYANYIMRQSFINKEGIIKYNDLTFQLKTSEPFKDLGSNSSQYTLKLLCKDWKSFMELLKMYNKNPNSLLGRPKLPKYKDKNGRHICTLTNWQSQIKEGYLYFAFKTLRPFNNTIKTNIAEKHLQTRIVPKGNIYILEIVYETEIQEPKEFNNKILGIDLGVNNFATLTNNIGMKPIVINGRVVKSINQYWNKQLAKYESDLKKRHDKNWSNKLQRITTKRNNKMEYFLHCASKSVIEYCKELDINTIVIGLNKTWKQECKLNKIVNQGFIQLPYDEFINKIKYKAQNEGMEVIVHEESYTSGTSFLDGELPIKQNYDKSRRIHRGMFKSNTGKLINSDVNGSYQIIIKVFPEAFVDGIEDVGLHPIRVNV